MDDDSIFESGMVLHIEPGCIEEDGVYVLEELGLVTENGSKVLSHALWECRPKKEHDLWECGYHCREEAIIALNGGISHPVSELGVSKY